MLEKIRSLIPSGISQATIAISARTHKIKLGTLEYSFLQCSAKCLPKIENQNNIFTHLKKLERKTMQKFEVEKPVTTPRLAAKDCIISAAHEATNMIHNSYKKT